MPDESISQDQARAETDAISAWQAVPYAVSHEEAQRVSREYLDAARKEFEEQITHVARTGQDAARQAEMQLNANGWEAYVNTKWWGFEVVLNAAAAQAAADISELVGEIAGNLLPKPIGALVEAAFKIRAEVIRAIGKDYGCRLVSPWTAPLMLIPIPLAPRQDTSLWWTVMNSAHNWSQDEKFSGHLSKANPALAEFRGKLYCVHRGDQDDKLWWTVYDPERNNGWSADTAFSGHFSGDGPALAVYNDHLYCVHRGAGNDKKLWWTRYSGTSWSADTQMNGATSRGPALATFNGLLYCAYKDANSAQMWWTRFNGTSWSADTLFGGHNTDSNPALAVYNGLLYCVHRGGGNDQNLWWTRYNGTSWSADTQLPGHMSAQGPAIAAYRDPNGTENQLFCVHRGA